MTFLNERKIYYTNSNYKRKVNGEFGFGWRNNTKHKANDLKCIHIYDLLLAKTLLQTSFISLYIITNSAKALWNFKDLLTSRVNNKFFYHKNLIYSKRKKNKQQILWGMIDWLIKFFLFHCSNSNK